MHESKKFRAVRWCDERFVFILGLIYLALKYWVDRHNLCFAYKSSKIDNRIHEAAINYVMTSVFCLELTVMSFILLRAGSIILLQLIYER